MSNLAYRFFGQARNGRRLNDRGKINCSEMTVDRATVIITASGGVRIHSIRSLLSSESKNREVFNIYLLVRDLGSSLTFFFIIIYHSYLV